MLIGEKRRERGRQGFGPKKPDIRIKYFFSKMKSTLGNTSGVFLGQVRIDFRIVLEHVECEMFIRYGSKDYEDIAGHRK